MKAKRIALAVIFVFCSAAGALLVQGGSSLMAAAGVLPQASFDDVLYKFSQALEGDKVAHDFIVKNTGGQTLIIEKVLTG